MYVGLCGCDLIGVGERTKEKAQLVLIFKIWIVSSLGRW